MHYGALLTEIGAVLLGLGLLGRFSGRYGISPIPLYLLAGLAFGEGGVLRLTASHEFFSVLAEIGVALLLLTLGLEYAPDQLTRNLRLGARPGVLDALLNATPGAVLGLLLGWGPAATLALAGITWDCSSGVIAKILRDLRRLGNRETPTILSVLVIEDLAMAFYLPILTALLARQGLLTGAVSLVIAVGAVAAVLIVATRYGRFVSALVSARDPEALVLGVLGLTLAVAGIAQKLHVSAAVGAFLVGIALSGQVAHHAEQVMAPLRDMSAAVFFLSFGLATRVSVIPSVLPVAAALAVVTIVGKAVTGYASAKWAGIATPGRWRAGLTLVPHGEFSIVIAGLAAASPVVDPRIGPLATAYVLITAIVGPLLARLPDTRWFHARMPSAGAGAAASTVVNPAGGSAGHGPAAGTPDE